MDEPNGSLDVRPVKTVHTPMYNESRNGKFLIAGTDQATSWGRKYSQNGLCPAMPRQLCIICCMPIKYLQFSSQTQRNSQTYWKHIICVCRLIDGVLHEWHSIGASTPLLLNSLGPIADISIMVSP